MTTPARWQAAEHGVRVGLAERERLFAIDVLAGRGRRLDLRAVLECGVARITASTCGSASTSSNDVPR